jgi:hypothetical protein
LWNHQQRGPGSDTRNLARPIVPHETAVRLPDTNESERKDERTCANFAHVRTQAVEPTALSVQSIMGAMANRCAKCLLYLTDFSTACAVRAAVSFTLIIALFTPFLPCESYAVAPKPDV